MLIRTQSLPNASRCVVRCDPSFILHRYRDMEVTTC